MEMNQYATMIEATQSLRKRGFTQEFKLEEKGMRSLGSGKIYQSNDMQIVEFHRFEGMSNPSDMSAVFAVQCKDGTRGMIVTSYGTYADIKLISFLDKVKIKKTEQAS